MIIERLPDGSSQGPQRFSLGSCQLPNSPPQCHVLCQGPYDQRVILRHSARELRKENRLLGLEVRLDLTVPGLQELGDGFRQWRLSRRRLTQAARRYQPMVV